MWSTIMAPQAPSVLPSKRFIPQQHNREFALFMPAVPILPGKSFNQYKKPICVNNCTGYQTVDNSTNHQNSSHIIDSIKEKCPEAIPGASDNTPCDMCLNNGPAGKRERPPKHKRSTGKKSRQHQRRREIEEMMMDDGSQSHSNQSLDVSCTEEPHPLILEDFIERSPRKDALVTNTPRSRQCSVTDSEDSFIVFDHGDEGSDKTNESPGTRTRQSSMCESEDSFIMFERDDAEDDDISSESSDEEDSMSFDEGGDSDYDEVDFSFPAVERKKVTFASPESLCEVHPMVKWSYAYQAARKGPWEMYARDRGRFRDRILRLEKDIKHIFDPQHRANIYKDRFETLQ